MKPKPKVREAGLNDVISLLAFFLSLEKDPETRRFYRAYRCDGFRCIGCFLQLTYELVSKYLKRVTHKRSFMVLSSIEGKIIGVCHIDMKGDTGRLGIVIKPGFRGMGLGTILAREALRRARRLGVKNVFLKVDADNNVAIKFYERLGFKICGYSKDFRYKTKEQVDCLIMKLEL